MVETPQKIEQPVNAGWWATVREAVRGSDQDFTQGPLGRAIFLLAVPMVLEMVMESVFAVTDVFFVSRLGPEAVATVGLTESLLTIVYTMAIGLSVGATAMIARRVGEGDAEAAARTAMQIVWLGLLVSLILGVAGIIFAPRLLAVMGASPGVLQVGSGYARVMLGGEVSVVMLFLVNAIFRGAGDGAIAMRVLWLANSINILLGPCLIFGLGPFPELGVTGAAVATTIGRGTGALWALSRLVRGGGRVALRREHVVFDPQIMLRLVRLSAGATLQNFISTASWIGLVRIIAVFGDAALAGYTIGIRLIIFALLPAWGMANAAATMVGQSLGANNPQRAEQAVWRAAFYNACLLGTVGLVFIIAARPLVSVFTPDAAVAEHAVNCLRIISYGFILFAYGMVLTQAFNGAGDTVTPTVINLFVFWLFEIPLAYILAQPLGFGPRGGFWAVMLAFSALAIVSGLIFRQGRWKTRQV